jgi:hypothetical protein
VIDPNQMQAAWRSERAEILAKCQREFDEYSIQVDRIKRHALGR